MRRHLLGALALLLACTSVGNSPELCQRYEAQRATLRTFASRHQPAFLAIYQPCNGRGDPIHFVFKASQRKKAIPEGYQCYDDAQSAFERAVVAAFPPPRTGYFLVKLVHGGWVYANVAIKSDGTVTNYGGEPDYGITREFSQELPIEKQAEPRGPVLLCDGVYLNKLAAGVNLAVPLSDATGQHLGEVQLVTVER